MQRDDNRPRVSRRSALSLSSGVAGLALYRALTAKTPTIEAAAFVNAQANEPTEAEPGCGGINGGTP